VNTALQEMGRGLVEFYATFTRSSSYSAGTEDISIHCLHTSYKIICDVKHWVLVVVLCLFVHLFVLRQGLTM
jgi:hypothetical protein